MMRFLMHTKANKEAGGSREEFLLKAAQIPGIYVPAFYDVTYQRGRHHCILCTKSSGSSRESPKAADRRYGSKAIVRLKNRLFLLSKRHRIVWLLEIQRGCIRGCRFCQAGMIYRPVRERDVEELKESAIELC